MSTVTADMSLTWRDGKRYLWLLGLVVPLLPFVGFGLAEATGSELVWFIGPVVVFGLFPLLDWTVGLDRANPPEDIV